MGSLNVCWLLIIVLLISLGRLLEANNKILMDDDSIRNKPLMMANYIVHMNVSAMPSTLTTCFTWYSSILQSLLNNSTRSRSGLFITHTYDETLIGFGVHLSLQELEALKKNQRISSYQRAYVP